MSGALTPLPGALCPHPRSGGEPNRGVSKVRIRQSPSPQLSQSWEGPYPAVLGPPHIYIAFFSL